MHQHTPFALIKTHQAELPCKPSAGSLLLAPQAPSRKAAAPSPAQHAPVLPLYATHICIAMLTPEQKNRYAQDGYIILPDFKSAADIAALRARAPAIVEAFDPA